MDNNAAIDAVARTRFYLMVGGSPPSLRSEDVISLRTRVLNVYLTVCWLTSDLDMSNIGSYYTRSMSQLYGGFTSDQRYEIF